MNFVRAFTAEFIWAGVNFFGGAADYTGTVLDNSTPSDFSFGFLRLSPAASSNRTSLL